MKKDKESLHGRLGISQKLLADYLGIGRSSLTMYEHGHRDLSYKGSSRRAPLRYTLETLDSYPPPASMQKFDRLEAEELKKHMEWRASFCTMQLLRVNRKLQRFQEDYPIAMDALKLSGVMLAKLPDDDTDDTQRQRLYLEMLESDAWKRIKKCGQAAQGKLQLQVRALTAELDGASSKLAEMDAP